MWAAALREFKPSHPATCNHEQKPLDSSITTQSSSEKRDSSRYGVKTLQNLNRHQSEILNLYSHTSSRTQSDTTNEASISHKTSRPSSFQRFSRLVGLPSRYDTSNSNAGSTRRNDLYGSRSTKPFQIQNSTSNSFLSAGSGQIRPVCDGNSKPKPQSHCKECRGDDPAVFPFVSDVAPLAILIFLEAVHNHNELSFSPMTPAYIPERPEYLSNGLSFRVTRVPWQQVRADTGGRIVSDAVYKRLNHNASRRAWLDFMKDVVVTHHMTYHVSGFHKRNVVELLGLGWERVIDDVLGEPTLAPVIALEYATFGTLQDLFYSSSFLSSYKRKLRLLSDVAEGIRALHFSNVIHGDVKPKNILVCKDHAHGIIAKLCDFGLSIIDPGSGPELQWLPGGTVMYLAPEAGNPVLKDRLKYTDVYSFGIVAWQTLLGGTIPFFSPRFRDGEFLSEVDVRNLKTGKHDELAALYGIHVDSDQFSRINQGEELQLIETYEPPNDPVNDLLIAMASETLGQMTSSMVTDRKEAAIPASELPTLLSVLQISLSSCPVHRQLESVLILFGYVFYDLPTII